MHWQLTGRKVLGIGDASGMIPVDPETGTYHKRMVDEFDRLVEGSPLRHKLSDILPEVLNAGENAGELTAEGAMRLDPTGRLRPGVPFCPRG